MIEVVEDSILNTDCDIIVQQVNCLGKMGKGLSGVIDGKYNNVKKEYKKYCKKHKDDGGKNEDLLGRVQLVRVSDGKVVANIFSQKGIRENVFDRTNYTDSHSLFRGIEKTIKFAELYSLSIAIPTHIGCGLANGNWDYIKSGIEHIFSTSKVKVKFYHYK